MSAWAHPCHVVMLIMSDPGAEVKVRSTHRDASRFPTLTTFNALCDNKNTLIPIYKISNDKISTNTLQAWSRRV